VSLPRLSLEKVAERADAILAEVERAVVGKRQVLELVLAGLLANGHVLLEDFPGLAKTLIARSVARATGLGFTRAQFTPDLMPADLTGSSVFDQRNGSFSFQPGPVFTNLLLADEVNRASPKTQAALLEAMQERQVTTDGVTRKLEAPFLVIATQNPIELEGTYPLPEAQLDRFILRTSVGYPSVESEEEMLDRRLERRADEVQLRAVVGREELLAMQQALEEVHVSRVLRGYIVALVAATRRRPSVEIGASPRGALALTLLSRAQAVLAGRDFVVPEDVKAVAVPALAHRLRLRPDLWVRGERPEKVVGDCLSEIPVPSTEEAMP
jgi:MoxR-like ATPase